eukprot:scaffold2661_cov120-Isochrysis_galbana.AAC.2
MYSTSRVVVVVVVVVLRSSVPSPPTPSPRTPPPLQLVSRVCVCVLVFRAVLPHDSVFPPWLLLVPPGSCGCGVVALAGGP